MSDSGIFRRANPSDECQLLECNRTYRRHRRMALMVVTGVVADGISTTISVRRSLMLNETKNTTTIATTVAPIHALVFLRSVRAARLYRLSLMTIFPTRRAAPERTGTGLVLLRSRASRIASRTS